MSGLSKRITVRVVNTTIRNLTNVLCRIQGEQLERVPKHGPLILVANHVNFLEVPIVYTRLAPRNITGYAKAETWDNPAMAFLFDLWEAIPLRRGEADINAVRCGLAALAEGKILAIAPEGTRSGNGRLGRGNPGVVILALQSGAPILPVAYYGGEQFRHNITQLRRTDFTISVGNPFYLQTNNIKTTRSVRQQIADEIMFQIAALLPPVYRGCYSELNRATETYLKFPPKSQSNLGQARIEQYGN